MLLQILLLVRYSLDFKRQTGEQYKASLAPKPEVLAAIITSSKKRSRNTPSNPNHSMIWATWLITKLWEQVTDMGTQVAFSVLLVRRTWERRHWYTGQQLVAEMLLGAFTSGFFCRTASLWERRDPPLGLIMAFLPAGRTTGKESFKLGMTRNCLVSHTSWWEHERE